MELNLGQTLRRRESQARKRMTLVPPSVLSSSSSNLQSPNLPDHLAQELLDIFAIEHIFDGPNAPKPPPSSIPEAAKRNEYYRTRDIWPRLLTPSLYEQMSRLAWKQKHKEASEGGGWGEPRWCKAWTKLYTAVEDKEWCRLLWMRQCDGRVADDVAAQLMRRPWDQFWAKRQELLDAEDRKKARDRDCLILAILWRKYLLFERQAGVPDLARVMQRLEPFEEDEKPSYAEREERAKNWTAAG